MSIRHDEDLILDPDERRIRYTRGDILDLLRVYVELGEGILPRRPEVMTWTPRQFRSTPPPGVWPRLLRADLDRAIAALPGRDQRMVRTYLETLRDRRGGSLREAARRWGLTRMSYWRRFYASAKLMADYLNGEVRAYVDQGTD